MSTLSNAMDVMKLIARLQRDITVTDAANELDWPKSSVSRTLSKMAEFGFLERDPVTRAYRPGEVIMEASYYFRASHSLISLLEDELQVLVTETGYTCYINLLDGAESMVIQMRTGTAGALQVYTPVGTRGPAYASSMGRAILARLSNKVVMQIVGPQFDASLVNAPQSREDLLARLETVRAQGWALSRGEFVSGVAGISSAVVDPASQKIYGIGIALPAQALTGDIADHFGVRVRDSAMKVGRQIGDRYWLDFAI